ncbi:MAG: hypothetical protein Ta2B_10880 [Termitinemataceae bacterium]|nr:MAG: hypothetical protein Ta2B_10880 [Termitinemataceae bacterium]
MQNSKARKNFKLLHIIIKIFALTLITCESANNSGNDDTKMEYSRSIAFDIKMLEQQKALWVKQGYKDYRFRQVHTQSNEAGNSSYFRDFFVNIENGSYKNPDMPGYVVINSSDSAYITSHTITEMYEKIKRLWDGGALKDKKVFIEYNLTRHHPMSFYVENFINGEYYLVHITLYLSGDYFHG